MNQITNSPVKEAMRQRNEADARNKEYQIRNKMNNDISKLVDSKNVSIVVGIILAVIGGAFSAVSGYGFFMGALLGLVVYAIPCVIVYSKNSRNASERKRLQAQAEKDIQEAYVEADRRTVQQINQYDAEVKEYSKRVLQKSDTISSMVQHNTDMFQRMVSHADAGSNMRFVEADFTYKVITTGIMYSYQSRYTNPQDDYNFDKQRFRNLNNDAECEGLAQALAKLTMKKMMGLYPPNSLHITVSHIDAEVTMHFKAANKNFVAARDIV